MGHGGRFAIIGVVVVHLLIHPGSLRPHRSHGNIIELLHLHAIGDECASALVRLAVMPHAPLMQSGLKLPVVLGCDQVGDRFAEVPEKSVAVCGTLDNPARQHRHPRHRIVATQFPELGNHVVGPVLRAGLPAVVHHVMQSTLADQVGPNGSLVAIQVGVHVLLHIPAVHLVHFKPGGLGCGRMIGDAEQRVAKAKHRPVAGRRSPVECPIRMHFRGQIDDVVLCDGVRGTHSGGRQDVEVRIRDECCFLLEAIDPCSCMERQFGDLVVGGRRTTSAQGGVSQGRSRCNPLECDAEILGGDCRERNRILRSSARRQFRCRAEVLAVVTGQQHFLGCADAKQYIRHPVWRHHHIGDGPNGRGRGELKLNPRGFTSCWNR